MGICSAISEWSAHSVLLVYMVGSTSLKMAKLLTGAGIDAESLAGEIIGLPQSNERQPSELVQLARDRK